MTGVLIGAAAAPRQEKPGGYILAGALASALPDLDAALYLVSADVYCSYHRVFTHTLFAAPILAGLAALAGWEFFKGSGFPRLYLIALAGLLVHYGMDILCDWPVLMFYPLSRLDLAQGYIQYSSSLLAVLITILTVAVICLRFGRKTGTAGS
jgi:membrane-bound metal-dependent hydrolase YbcI (DUF457 family)